MPDLFNLCYECRQSTSGACWLHRPALIVVAPVVVVQPPPPSVLPDGFITESGFLLGGHDA